MARSSLPVVDGNRRPTWLVGRPPFPFATSQSTEGLGNLHVRCTIYPRIRARERACLPTIARSAHPPTLCRDMTMGCCRFRLHILILPVLGLPFMAAACGASSESPSVAGSVDSGDGTSDGSGDGMNLARNDAGTPDTDGGIADGGTTDATKPDVSVAPSKATKIAAGGSHTCALTTTGGVKCWGDNSGGQLGNNTLMSSGTPVDVTGLQGGVAAISAGYSHTCAVTTTGGVKCWGINRSGQLGNNTITSSRLPVDVTGLASGVAAVSAGYEHTCALTATGGVKCWGGNSRGQLGNGTLTYSLVPVDVTGLPSGVAALSAAHRHACVLTTAGGAKCWGDNFRGQVGINSTMDSLVPVDVLGLQSGVASISAGTGHTCALTTAGGAKCWGWSSFGQTGNNSLSDSLVPTNVVGLQIGVIALVAGNAHSCALTTSGGVKCWGENRNKQLGDAAVPLQSPIPVDVSGLQAGVTAVALGFGHTCSLMTAGNLKCWGNNTSGQVGITTATSSAVPVGVSGF